MSNIRMVLLSVSLLAATFASAQKLWKPDDVFQEILSNNPALKSFSSRAAAQDARAEGSHAWMAPMVGAGTFMTPYPGANVMDENSKGSWMLSLEQEIPNPLKLKAREEFLKAQSAISMEGKAVLANELKAKARVMFYAILVESKRLRYLKQNRLIMSTMRKLGEIRYQYNQGQLTRVFKADGRIAEADNMITMSESNVRSKKIALNALMYRPPMAELQIDTAFEVRFVPNAGLDSSYFADSKSEIRRMDREILAMNLNIDQMKKQATPDFRLRFEHMVPRAGMMPNQYTLMGMLSLPFAPWSSKMYRSEVKSMQLERQAMQEQRAAMLSEMTGMSRSMQSELINMQEQLANYPAKILPALGKNLSLSMITYQENKADLDTVIDAWEAQNMAQMNYLDQLQKFFNMLAEYEKSIEK